MHIVQIDGPEVVRAGAELRLDCDYDYMAEEEPQLDLKWYFNGSPIPVGNLWLCNTCLILLISIWRKAILLTGAFIVLFGRKKNKDLREQTPQKAEVVDKIL